jgi:iron complex outermembrane recepter protein
MPSLAPFQLTPLAFAITFALSAPGFAQQAAAGAASPAAPAAATATTADADAARSLPVIVITATRTARNTLEVPASVDVINKEDIHDAKARVNASEVLDRIPGVVALNRQNYAQDLQISIRGFGARSSFGVRGLRLYVDGVPATLPDGQGQVSNFPLNAAESIEVLRGPFSALYGNSSGGVISLTTPLKPRDFGGEASYAAGSNETQRAAIDLAGGSDKVAYAIDGESFHTGGYRPHSSTGRATWNLRAGLLDTPVGELRLSANALISDNAQDPLGLSRALLQKNPDQTTPEAALYKTRKTTEQGTTGADLKSHLGDALLETSVWYGARAIRQFQAIPAGSQNAASSPGGVIDLGRHFGGVDSRGTIQTGPFTTTAGLDFERLVEDRYGYKNFTGTTAAPHYGVLGVLRRDETNSINSIDPYAQTELALSSAWRVLAGLRWTNDRFNSSDHYLVNGNDSGSVSYNGLLPTAGVVFRATPRVSYYVSYGRGFETPTLNELAYKPDGSAGVNIGLKAARSNNYEVGAKTDLGNGVRAEAALFYTVTSDDIVVRSNAGGRSGYANVGQTRRDGVEASFQAPLARGLTFAASGSLIQARFDTSFLTCVSAPCTTPTLPVASGNKLPSVPAATAWSEIKYRSEWADASLEARGQSALWVDDRNTDRAGGVVVLNAAVQRTFHWNRLAPHFFARVDNLANRRYVGSVIVNDANGRFFEPAPTRTWLLGVDLPF